MYRKNCDKCNKSSFSSSEFEDWICPICGKDLTEYPFFDAITSEQIHVKVKKPQQTSVYKIIQK